MVGCEIADYLASHGYKIDIVKQLTSGANHLTNTRHVFLLERLKRIGARLILGAKPLEVNLPWARLVFEERETVFDKYDSLVYAIGRQPNNELKHILEECSLPVKVFTVGDASSPRTALEAIHEAALTAAEI
jgi:pyruvate/2-oxoglutarate dehydrogenase complex dihydrolipoamide dehydrogenase (E3) component